MKAFVAGATGSLGGRVVQRLVVAGHDVVGLTRSKAKAADLRAAGATPVVGDLLDSGRMHEVLRTASPDVVFQLVNALPPGGPRRFSDLDATNLLRDQGTGVLVDAAIAAGATRFVAESVVFSYGYGDLGGLLTEDTPVQQHAPAAAGQAALDAMHRQEEQVLKASADQAIEGIVLRVGGYYGPVPHMEPLMKLLRRRLMPLPTGDGGRLSFIHIDDAADAVVLAAEHGRPDNIYNIVDDEPVSLQQFADALAAAVGAKPPFRIPAAALKLGGQYMNLVAKTVLAVDNAKAKRELQWRPAHPTYQQGITDLVSETPGPRRRTDSPR